jgi:hypothetical protein
LREERRLRVFEDGILRRILGPKRDDVTEKWRKSHEKLNDLYFSPHSMRMIKLRKKRWAEHEACMGYERWILGFGGET